jgi:predicted RNase H-like HicB family nuclease
MGGMTMNEYTVLVTWDNEAQVWYCTSEDIPGLILESGSLDVLVERARHAAPEMLELMGYNPSGAFLSFRACTKSGILAL